jgi:hypothetical protein
MLRAQLSIISARGWPIIGFSGPIPNYGTQQSSIYLSFQMDALSNQN